MEWELLAGVLGGLKQRLQCLVSQ
uniref:Uncharacterized protein n=1 Tax=Arundo donax TaxID=35708 RepID=A0A0A9BZA4_ARUDO